MQKTNANKNTALAIVVIATAVVLIGGLALVPTATMQSASAARGGEPGPPEPETSAGCFSAKGGAPIQAYENSNGVCQHVF